MNDSTTLLTCLNCGRSEQQVPLVALRYNQTPGWICSQCLPILIHQPQRLAGKLKGAENLPPAAEH
ncbi:MAG: hypothetical protein D6775_09470 [Caldilineae bacterium]|nr:MAG: hypothetical protein D6775_09470 [Caldilineae bacterium]